MDGLELAAVWRGRLKKAASVIRQKTGRRPHLHVIMVGDHPPSQLYVQRKREAAEAVEIDFALHAFPEDIGQDRLLKHVKQLNADPACDGMIVQLPLPQNLDTSTILEAVEPQKDLDGLHPYNRGCLYDSGRSPFFIPCTPWGCLQLLQANKVDLMGLHVLIIGRSCLVGRPFAAVCLRKNATVTIAHSHTKNLPQLVRTADVVCVAVGRPAFFKGAWLKKGAVVLDVGIHKVAGIVCGDVDRNSALENASYISPVPGGIGPMTVTGLLYNCLKASFHHAGLLFPLEDDV